MAKPEKAPKGKKEEPSMDEKLAEKLESFLLKSDDPGISYQEQNELLEKSESGDLKAGKKYLESKQSKYRVNALTGALLSAEMFINYSNKAKNLSEQKLQDLTKRIEQAEDAVNNERVGLITKETVYEVISIVKEVQLYLKEK